jgi:hypothetical protein
MGRVYFVVCRHAAMVKIGWSQQPARRLSDLQTGSPLPLVLAGSFAGTKWDETNVHREVWQDRSHREWYHLTGTVRLVATRRGVDLDADICGSYVATEVVA